MSVLFLATAGCAGSGECQPGDGRADTCVPGDDWKQVDTKCEFSFRAPADITEIAVQGTDSCVVQYEAEGCKYSADYGWYSGTVDQLAAEPGYRTWTEQIDGQNAQLASFGPVDEAEPYGAAIHFAELPADSNVKLTIYARCDSADAQRTALQVFQTLTF